MTGTRLIYFVTHPEVVIDPNKDVRTWSLSEVGIRRAKEMLKQPWIKEVKSISSSKEQKALDLAQVVADYLDLEIMTLEELGEIDRSSTGFIGEGFWEVVDAFYSNPTESARGWERAMDAQQRIISAVKRVIESTTEQNIFIASHGAVGALLLSYLKKTDISIKEDQPGKGGGNYFVFGSDWKLIHAWKPIDMYDEN